MAKSDLLKFRDLLNSDADFQEKFRKAAEAYTGEQDEKSVFENLLLPLAKEYGLSATYEEFKEYTSAFAGKADAELSENELAQVAGGKDSGIGVCMGVGVGDMIGVHGHGDSFYACGGVGFATVCLGVGGY